MKDKQGPSLRLRASSLTRWADSRRISYDNFWPNDPWPAWLGWEAISQRLGSGQVMPMFTRIKQENVGTIWMICERNLTERYSKLMANYFPLPGKKHASVDLLRKSKFRITQFSEAEIRGVGVKIRERRIDMKIGFILGALLATWWPWITRTRWENISTKWLRMWKRDNIH